MIFPDGGAPPVVRPVFPLPALPWCRDADCPQTPSTLTWPAGRQPRATGTMLPPRDTATSGERTLPDKHTAGRTGDWGLQEQGREMREMGNWSSGDEGDGELEQWR